MQDYEWGHDRRFNSYPEYFGKIFGERVQKLTIDAGFTCPNRDGKVGFGGCTFCINDAFNPSYCSSDKSISQQLDEGVDFHKFRYRRVSKYLAYFQAYSNTYADLAELKIKYEEALAMPGVVGLIIGTRPDCVDEEKLDYLADLSKKCYVSVEYGIESIDDHILQAVNRGHDYKKAVWAVNETHKRGLKTGAHFMLGFPGQTQKEIINMTDAINELPLTTIKFHQLQIFKNTKMAMEFNANPERFDLFDLNTYLYIMVEMIQRLKPSIVIERIAAEAPPRYLEVSSWAHVRYDEILRMLEKRLEEADVWQGKKYKI